MAESFLLKGILIGLLFGIPVGAVGTLAAQRAFRYGLWDTACGERFYWNLHLVVPALSSRGMH